MVTETEEKLLARDLARFRHDPYRGVMYMFPWGQGELAEYPGPRDWQKKVLLQLGEDLRHGEITTQQAILKAISSGHGIGKTALVCMVICWAMSTFEDTRGVVTANTENQLRTKTWAELAKWHRLMINSHWFRLTATAFFYDDKPNTPPKDRHELTWRIDKVPWVEHKTEAFAGLHNKGKRLLVIFDEASAIPDKIWEVTEGALTDEKTEIIWCVFGNGTRNTGRFRECFGKYRHLWNHGKEGFQIDSRLVEGTNKTQLQSWVDTYGEDSDFVRVRVRGLFPNASSVQFIPSDLVFKAQKAPALSIPGDPLIMAVDLARGGDDNCVIRWRRGLDGRTLPPRRLSGEHSADSMRVAGWVIQAIEETKPDAVFYDGTGIGGPIGNRIRQLGYSAIEVQFGGSSPDPHYANMRSYMWMMLREALRLGLAIDDSPTLQTDLTSPEYHHDRHDKIVLESKEDMKRRGLASPDDGDAEAMLFAYPVAPKLDPLDEARVRFMAGGAHKPGDWDPFSEDRM